jgi:hypothetical protein
MKQGQVRKCRVGVAIGASTLLLGVSLASAATPTSSVSPRLRAQARALYAPVKAYEAATTRAQRAGSHTAGIRVGKVINACQAPYLKRLQSRRAAKVDDLWQHATLLETYQVEVKAVGTPLAALATSWRAMSLGNRTMNTFVHAMAAEFRATLDARGFDSCAFVRGIAAHHFSFAWARRSVGGVEAARWWAQISRAGDRTDPFWRYVLPTTMPGAPPPPGPGPHLFTSQQLAILANLPGEIS